MHIYLYGPSGSGKSTVGILLAQLLNLPFLDLDAEIERDTGLTILEIITNQGEENFREAESRVLNKCLTEKDMVVALGGGALLRDANRKLVERTGQVVFLDAELSILIKRLEKDHNIRPLLGAGDAKTVARLMKDREIHYESFPLRVDASSPPEQIVAEIQRQIGRYYLSSMGSGYDVLVKAGGLDRLGSMLKTRLIEGPVLVVSDSNVGPLYTERVLSSLGEAGYQTSQIIIQAGEEYKTLKTVSSLWRGCLDADLDRNSTIISLGGGVVNDLVGFVASTFMRGCGWISVPTSLLAMVDASIGGKTGIDLPEGKNLVGSFHSPKLVLADPEVLATLPEEELRAGLGEVVKHGVIADSILFDLCQQGWKTISIRLPEVVRRAMAVKVKIVEEDPYETGIRAALNFGHTVGHAVEHVSKYSLRHGEAVAIGMIAETRFAERISVADKGLSALLAETLEGIGLPVQIPADLPQDDLIQAMKGDKKKSAGMIRFALPVRVGEIEVGVEVDSLNAVLEDGI
ncbi:MAG: 3-dehydroquinate synthase [Anaerolineales bacterium]|nr:3-dehydroquinate synthase [Anaerolineales bacterium]